MVQFASEPRVELPLQAIETAAFQACVAELVTPESTERAPGCFGEPKSAQVCRAYA